MPESTPQVQSIEIAGDCGEQLLLHCQQSRYGGVLDVSVEWNLGHTVRLPYRWRVSRHHFSKFHEQLVDLQRSLSGRAVLSPEDDEFVVAVQPTCPTSRGLLLVDCRFAYKHASSDTAHYMVDCRLAFRSEQSLLSLVLASLAVLTV